MKRTSSGVLIILGHPRTLYGVANTLGSGAEPCFGVGAGGFFDPSVVGSIPNALCAAKVRASVVRMDICLYVERSSERLWRLSISVMNSSKSIVPAASAVSVPQHMCPQYHYMCAQNAPEPLLSISAIIFLTSCSVGLKPKARMATSNSLASMQPERSVSKRLKASRISFLVSLQ